MYKDYDECVREEGKFKTKKLGPNKYIHVAYDKEGNEYVGPTFTKKERHKKNKKVEQKKKFRKLKRGDKELIKLKEFFEGRRGLQNKFSKSANTNRGNQGGQGGRGNN